MFERMHERGRVLEGEVHDDDDDDAAMCDVGQLLFRVVGSMRVHGGGGGVFGREAFATIYYSTWLDSHASLLGPYILFFFV